MKNNNYLKKYLFYSLEKNSEKYKYILYTMLVVSLVTYSTLIITGVTCPDGLCEGFTYYSGANWASRNGRWAIRYLNMITGNLVMPIYTVSVHCICISIVVLMIADLFKIQKRISIVSITAVMIASPSVIAQFLYTYMALAYGTSCLLSTFFVWVLYKGKKKQKYVLASVSLALSLGLYQSYIGFSILLVIMIFIKEFLEERFRTVLGGYEIYRMWVRWVRIIPFNNEIRFENS